MNTLTIVGKVLDHLGHAQARRLVPVPGGLPRLETRSWATAANGVRRRQPSAVLDIDHDRIVGRVVAYDLDAGGLWATAICHDLDVLTDHEPWWYSAAVDYRSDGTDIVLTGLALTHKPAGVGLRPVELLVGELARTAHRSSWRLPTHTRERIERAARNADNRGDIIVHDALALEEQRRELLLRQRLRSLAR